jgi:hypothetical protein
MYKNSKIIRIGKKDKESDPWTIEVKMMKNLAN